MLLLHKVWHSLFGRKNKVSLWLYYEFFGKFLFHFSNFPCQDFLNYDTLFLLRNRLHQTLKWSDKCKNKFPFTDAQALARSRSVIQECEIGESEENSENSIPPLTSISSYDLSSCFKKETNNLEWSVTFEQFLASIMNESCLVDYFDHQVDVVTKLKKYGDTKLNRHESVDTAGSKSVFYAWYWSILLIIYCLSQNSYPNFMDFLKFTLPSGLLWSSSECCDQVEPWQKCLHYRVQICIWRMKLKHSADHLLFVTKFLP